MRHTRRLPDIPDDERRHIVALHGTDGERAHAGEDRVEELRDALLAVRFDAFQQPSLAVLLPRSAQRLRDAVAEGHEQVAGLEIDRFLLENGVLEEAEDQAALVEANHVLLAPEE